ncbi:hypothetical protein ACPFL9_00605 [Paenarthrobacter sp. NyZ202]|uniref:hypothetical protein n=1 Tax=Paenarthrobacter sp. NyZ202 TaxID=3402689 RepID=UPI003CF8B2F1
MTESQSPQDGSFAAPRTGVPAGTEPYSGSYLDAPVDTETTYTGTTGTTGGTESSGKVETAKQEAAGVAGAAKDAAGGVVDTAKTEASHVAQEVKLNARQLLHQTKGELTDQAATQQQRVAEGLRSISDELSTMANASTQGGVASDLVQQAAQRSSSVAQWLENRDPGSLLDEVKSFARRKPGAFLLIAAGAGVLAGRLGRGMAGAASEDASTGTAPTTPRAEYYPTSRSAVTPPPVDLPGPEATTSGYGTNAGYGAATTTGYGAGATGGLDGSTAPYPETDAGGVKAQGDPLAGPLDPDDPQYGGSR